MAIAKKPSAPSKIDSEEQAAEAFITAAAQPSPAATNTKQQTTLRFDRELLARIDAAAKRRGVSRSALDSIYA